MNVDVNSCSNADQKQKNEIEVFTSTTNLPVNRKLQLKPPRNSTAARIAELEKKLAQLASLCSQEGESVPDPDGNDDIKIHPHTSADLTVESTSHSYNTHTETHLFIPSTPSSQIIINLSDSDSGEEGEDEQKLRIRWLEDEIRRVELVIERMEAESAEKAKINNIAEADADAKALQQASSPQDMQETGLGALTTVYVGNLDVTVTEFRVKKIFNKCGPINKVNIIVHKAGPHRGENKGYCFIEFADPDSAVKAINEMHGVVLNGRKVHVRYSNSMARESTKKTSATFATAVNASIQQRPRFADTEMKVIKRKLDAIG